MNPLFNFSPALPYAETHYKFKFPWSPLFKKMPEIFVDGPRFCLPGRKPPVYLVIKDADYFPVKICEVSVNCQFSGKSETQKIPISRQPVDHIEVLPLDISFPDGPCSVVVNTRIAIELPNGKRVEVFNSNLPGLSRQPVTIEMFRDELPYPPGWLAGETHCHSSYSSNPIEFGAPLNVLQEAGEALGLDYAACTDHSWDFYYDQNKYMVPVDPQLNWKRYLSDIQNLNRSAGSSRAPFIIPGEEVSCGNHKGQNVHLLVMGYDKFIPGLGDGGRRWFNNKPSLSISEVLEMIGDTPSFAAHPRVKMGWLERLIFRRGMWGQEDVSPTQADKQVTGLQFWNGHRYLDFSLGRAYWVQQLLKGHKLLPAAGNDAHGDLNSQTGVKLPLFYLYQSLNHVYGIVRTLVQSSEKTLSGIQQGMRAGNQVCTDGPFLLLEKEGGRLKITGRSSSDLGGVWKIHLFSGAAGDAKETVVNSWEYKAGTFSCDEAWDKLNPVSYYRAEAWTHKNKLAITSPVFL